MVGDVDVTVPKQIRNKSRERNKKHAEQRMIRKAKIKNADPK